MPGFDLKQVSRNDQIVMGAGALAFIFSFFPDYAVTGKFGLLHGSVHYNGWQGIGILSILLFLVAGGIVAVRNFTQVQLPKLPLGWNVIVAGAAALGTVFLLLEGFVLFDPYGASSVPGVSTGFGWGGYILLILGVAQTAFGYMTMKASGEKIAWDSSAMGKPAQASAPADAAVPPQAAPSYQPPAAPGYQPPPAPGYQPPPPADQAPYGQGESTPTA
jgi:hypothetical protein